MKSRSILTLAAVIGLFTLTPVLRLHAEPHSIEALDQLEKARKAEHPIEHLERAKHELEESEHVEHHERKEAFHQINDAIDDARKGERRRMDEHIGFAIHEIREGRH